MNSSSVIAIAALCFAAGCSGPYPVATRQPSAAGEMQLHHYPRLTQTEVRDRLMKADASPGRLYSEINAMATAASSVATCETLKSLWDGQPPADLKLEPNHLEAPMVRMGLASALHQCARERGNEERLYYAYVRSVLEQSPDETDRSRAAIKLGVVGSDQDIELLRSYVRGANNVVAIGAVGGLSMLRSSAATKELKAIASDMSLAENIRTSAKNTLTARESVTY